MYNKVILVGNLTRDIEIRYLPSGMALSKTAIATSRKFKGSDGQMKEEVCFIDLTFWGRSAEVANQYLRKGSKVLVEGRLTFEQWSNSDGKKQSKHSLTVEIMQMLDTKADRENLQNSSQSQYSNNSNNSTSNNQYNQNNQYNKPKESFQKPAYQEEKIPEIDITEDDIPF